MPQCHPRVAFFCRSGQKHAHSWSPGCWAAGVLQITVLLLGRYPPLSTFTAVLICKETPVQQLDKHHPWSGFWTDENKADNHPERKTLSLATHLLKQSWIGFFFPHSPSFPHVCPISMTAGETCLSEQTQILEMWLRLWWLCAFNIFSAVWFDCC